jgi:hypothetical protein
MSTENNNNHMRGPTFRIMALLVAILLVVSMFSLLLTPTAVSSFSNNSSSASAALLLFGKGGGHSGGGKSFTCPTISGADSSVCSSNWSGWADTGSSDSVSAAYGSWRVPGLSCPKHGTTYVALWVGIDGYSDSTVEQTGVLGECSSGIASYSAWYEFYPNPSVTISSVSVSPGDVVNARVTYSSSTNEFTTTITNVNTGVSYSASASVSGAKRTSAEWIVERPALCNVAVCRLTTLANFGTGYFGEDNTGVTGTNYATINGANEPIGYSSFSTAAITMVASSTGPILAQPSALSTDGTSFTVTYA